MVKWEQKQLNTFCFITYSCLYLLWFSFLFLFGIQWLMLSSASEPLPSWKRIKVTSVGEVWLVVPSCLCWKTWNKRNISYERRRIWALWWNRETYYETKTLLCCKLLMGSPFRFFLIFHRLMPSSVSEAPSGRKQVKVTSVGSAAFMFVLKCVKEEESELFWQSWDTYCETTTLHVELFDMFSYKNSIASAFCFLWDSMPCAFLSYWGSSWEQVKVTTHMCWTSMQWCLYVCAKVFGI